MGSFSMASMTDIVFLLLIFFMVSSTLVVSSSLRVTLPQSSQHDTERPATRIVVDADFNYFVGQGKDEDIEVEFDEIAPFLESVRAEQPDMFVILYADEELPYREIVRLLNVAVENDFQMVLATRPIDKTEKEAEE